VYISESLLATLSRIGFFLNSEPQWTRAQILDLRHHTLRSFGELGAHRRGNIEHLHTLGFQPDRVQYLLKFLHAASGVYITFQVMTVTGQSTGDHNAVSATLKSMQYLKRIHTSGAGDFDDFDLRRILDA
jgi:hypothetical protein